MRRTIGRELAGAGYVEVISNPFLAPADADRLQLPADDPRRSVPRLVNPIKDDEPLLRGTLLPGLLRVLGRNIGRGFADVALFELGQVFLTRPEGQRMAPILPVDRGPTVQELATLQAALPDQPLHLAVALAGDRELPGWWGAGRPAGKMRWRRRGRCSGSAGHRSRSGPTSTRRGIRAGAPPCT